MRELVIESLLATAACQGGGWRLARSAAELALASQKLLLVIAVSTPSLEELQWFLLCSEAARVLLRAFEQARQQVSPSMKSAKAGLEAAAVPSPHCTMTDMSTKNSRRGALPPFLQSFIRAPLLKDSSAQMSSEEQRSSLKRPVGNPLLNLEEALKGGVSCTLLAITVGSAL